MNTTATEVTVKRSEVEASRKVWEKVAKENGWHVEPFYIQFWVYEDGLIQDSVGHKGMEKIGRDVFILVEDDLESDEDGDVVEIQEVEPTIV